MYEWNENLIGSRTESSDFIYINLKDKNYIKKLNQIFPDHKDKFKRDYLNSIYLCILLDSLNELSATEKSRRIKRYVFTQKLESIKEHNYINS